VVELFRARPELVVGLLSGALGYAVPEYAGVRLASNDLNDYKPTEYQADAVIILTDPDGNPVLAVIVEAQLRPDPGKRWAWPAYFGNLQARLRCPVVLVPTARHGRALALYGLGKYAEARDEWMALVNRSVPRALATEASFWLGDTLGRLGDAEGAVGTAALISWYRKIEGRSPGSHSKPPDADLAGGEA